MHIALYGQQKKRLWLILIKYSDLSNLCQVKKTNYSVSFFELKLSTYNDGWLVSFLFYFHKNNLVLQLHLQISLQ